MSETNKTDLFPDGSGDYKLSEEARAETDSGFLSGGNILVSGEICSQEQEEESLVPPPAQPSRQDQQEKEAYMHIDSGVDLCLSEKLSGLSLKHPELNDLNASSKAVAGAIKPPPPSIITTKEEPPQPWQIYFEQDEDGDT